MNATTRMLPGTLYSQQMDFMRVLFSRQIMMIVLLACAVFVSGIAVVYVKTLNRHLYSQLQISQSGKDQLQVQWSQLLLEQSTWSTQARVDRIASDDLGMELPESKDTVLVRDE